MSDAALASNLNVNTVGGFVRKAATSSLGAKVIMAVTGILMVVWLVLHLAGNMTVFASASMMNEYAYFLKSKPELLWPMRIGLFVIVTAHIFSGIRLARLNRAARPVQYSAPKKWRQASLASRTMAVSGLILLGFIIFHIMTFTLGFFIGDAFPKEPDVSNALPDVYAMVVTCFRTPWIVPIYVVGMALLGMHLSHGIWSSFQSMGLNGPRWTPFAKKAGFVSGIALALLFASIPVTIALRVSGNDVAPLLPKNSAVIPAPTRH